ncbi:dynamin family protein [Nonomuraea gerenzanensis]|uniref:Dynamin N-terminal domain-containing protein n=1 Tax=Nonomuraea gerenzanensis TaxID=93944 RepID=A0A1M4EEJ0_9ACTN|nr:dynamin family protein [Nonomuraea gerenzanensis]UBU08839.1 dynamin family protein [Nonomuraea gerenzanensis]SBO97202.1 hypothetical protein BN4615_P6718 [Nonomuraea gerenzanensis]
MNDPIARLRELTTSVAALSEQAGLPEAAKRLCAERDVDGPPAATVVVVGETKRGKSSLINALVGRPGLLPVEADIATAVHITVRHAPEDGALAHLVDGSEPLDIGVAGIPAYASAEGNPGNAKGVRSVTVGLDAALLGRGLDLVDTPGVAGLEAGHTEITLAALAMADALLLVVDASAPLTAAELRFLARATERVEYVSVVLTKTDVHPGWASVAEANRELLRLHAPRFAAAPVIPVSSRLKAEADLARAEGEVDIAEQLHHESGFDRLERLLADDVIGRAERLRAVNLTRLVLTVLDRIDHTLSARLAAAAGDPSGGLGAERRRYEELTRLSARWRQDLAAGFQKIGVDLQSEIARHLQELSGRCERIIVQAAPELLETMPRELGDAVDGRWADLNAFVRTSAEEVVAEILLREDARIDIDDLPMPGRLRALPLVAADEPQPPGEDGFGDLLSAGWPALGVFMASSTLLSSVLGPLGPAAALVVSSAMLRHRYNELTRVRTQREARLFAKERLELIRREMTAQLSKHVIDLRRRLEGEIATRLDSRRRRLQADLESASARPDAAATEELRECTRQLAARAGQLKAALG